MPAAERDGELVAHFAAERAGLGEAQVMRVGWLATANDTGLRGDKPKMLLVAVAARFGDCEDALVDCCGIGSTGYVRGRSGRTGGWLDLFSGQGRLLVNCGRFTKLCQPQVCQGAFATGMPKPLTSAQIRAARALLK